MNWRDTGVESYRIALKDLERPTLIDDHADRMTARLGWGLHDH